MAKCRAAWEVSQNKGLLALKTLKEDHLTHRWDDSIEARERVYQLVLAFVLEHNNAENIYQSDSAQLEALELATQFSIALNYTRVSDEDDE